MTTADETPEKAKAKAKDDEISVEKPVPEKAKGPELPTIDNFLDFDYRKGEWSGLPNFGCPACEFYTLQGNEVVAEHYFTAHLSREG